MSLQMVDFSGGRQECRPYRIPILERSMVLIFSVEHTSKRRMSIWFLEVSFSFNPRCKHHKIAQ
jgi:hypothetical protein